MMKKYFLALFLLLAIHFNVNSQQNIDLGEKAPAINITEWIANVPENKDLDNKFKVLEFWTTWCGPCLGAVPHMNELTKEFESQILFLSITNESPEKVNRTLNRMEFLSTVVTDQTSFTQQEYGDGKSEYTALPMTVLIDNKNIVKWIGQPQMLNRNILKALLAGNIEEKNAFKYREKEDKDDFMAYVAKINKLKNSDINYYLELKKVDNSMDGMTIESSSFYVHSNTTIKTLLSELIGTYSSLVNLPEEYRNQQFEIIYKNKNPSIDFKTDFLNDVVNRLNLKWNKEKTITEGYQLSLADKSKLEKTLDVNESGRSDIYDFNLRKNTGVNYTNYTIKDFSIDLSKTTGYLFSFKNEDTGKYDFTIETNTIADIKRSLKYYGIEIELSNIEADKHVFTKL